jgi:Sec-independent protein secretion pathway component TatC
VHIAELVFVVLAAIPGGVAIALARRGGWLLAPVARPPFPTKAGILTTAAAVLGAIAGLVLGAALLEPTIPSSLPEHATIAVSSPAEALVAQLRIGAVVATGLALPGFAALGWLARSHDRSARAAALFGVVVALGFAAGAAAGWLLAPLGSSALYLTAGGLGIAPTIGLDDLAAQQAAGAFGLGIAGALLTAAAAGASRTIAALKATLALTGATVPASLLLAAILTPPDVVSQLMLATALIGAWLAGLAIGGAILFVRGKGSATPVDGAR